MNWKSQLKALLILCAVFTFPRVGFTQIDFRKGFMVTHEMDTIFGLANFHDGARAFEICQFKKTSNDEATEYSPTDIFGYGFVDGRKYVSKLLQSKDSSINATVFAELLVMGRINLYRYRETFWVEKEGTKVTQLRNDVVERVIDEQLYRRNSKEYVGTFNILMFDCGDLLPQIEKVLFNQRRLVELVESYNNCRKEDKKLTRVDKPWIKFIVGANGGVSRSEMDVSDLKILFGDGLVQTEQLMVPMIGASLDIFSPRISERFLFTTGLLYAPAKYHLHSAVTRSAMQYVVLDLDVLKLPFGVRYTFAPRFITPFVNAGISGSFHLDRSSIWMQEVTANNVVHTMDRGTVPLKSSQVGIWGGVGMLVRVGSKMDALVEIRYERTDGVVDMGYIRQYSSNVTNLQLLFGLRYHRFK